MHQLLESLLIILLRTRGQKFKITKKKKKEEEEKDNKVIESSLTQNSGMD
jgi:hypothetical protein